MIPLRDVIPSRTFPFFTIAFIVFNSVAFLFEMSLPQKTLEVFVREYGVVPAEFSWLAVLTSMFLHGDWLHFLGNMLYLWIFGDNVEDRLGKPLYILFYLVTGIAATMAQYAVVPGSSIPNVGASGAIAGVLGAYLVMFPKARVNVIVPGGMVMALPALIVLGFWMVLQVFSGVGAIATTDETASTGGVAYMAHVGGFIAGMALGLLAKPFVGRDS